jgi:ABC-2 type transport system ATP-binding protein
MFNVEHSAPLNGLPAEFELKSTETQEDGILESAIQINGSASANDLLKKLVAQTEIRSFREVIPSVNDIFIRKVKEDSNG